MARREGFSPSYCEVCLQHGLANGRELRNDPHDLTGKMHARKPDDRAGGPQVTVVILSLMKVYQTSGESVH
jgi:hypothetical protein